MDATPEGYILLTSILLVLTRVCAFCLEMSPWVFLGNLQRLVTLVHSYLFLIGCTIVLSYNTPICSYYTLCGDRCSRSSWSWSTGARPSRANRNTQTNAARSSNARIHLLYYYVFVFVFHLFRSSLLFTFLVYRPPLALTCTSITSIWNNLTT